MILHAPRHWFFAVGQGYIRSGTLPDIWRWSKYKGWRGLGMATKWFSIHLSFKFGEAP